MSEPRTGLVRPADRLHLLPRHRKMLVALLREHLPGIEVWAYGGRVNGQSHDGSDLDLVLRSPDLQEIPVSRVADLKKALRESNIPFLVEARDWAKLPEGFHREIERGYVVLVEATERPDHNRWLETTLGAVITLKRGYDLPQRKRCHGSVPVVSSSGIIDHHSESKVSGPGVVTGRYGTLGQVFFIPGAFWPHNTALYVQDFKGNDPRFIGYLLQSLDFSTCSDKAAVPGLNRNHLHEGLVSIPASIDEQRAIAHILGTLDDKIELNRRVNETLEAMAQALFQSWFVDFDPVRAKVEGRDTGLPEPIADLFPDRLVDSERGEIPQGWKAGRLADIAIAPRRNVDPASLDDGTPYIGLEHIPRRSIALTTWERIGKVTSNKSIFKKGEVLFGRLRPYFHKVGVAPINGACSTDIAVIASKSTEWSTFVLACVSSTEFVSYTNQGSTGTKMPRTNWTMMGDYRTCLPAPPAVGAFQNAMQPVVEQIIAKVLESRTLAGMRDALLPKLISGEMRMSDAEKIVGGLV